MMNQYWNERIECISREELAALQLVRLQQTVKRVYEKVPHYRQAFTARGITPGDIKSLADLTKLPFTTKQDLRDNYPFGLFAIPREEIVRIHASSGTTGKPTVVGYAQNDIKRWAEMVARELFAIGVTKNDVIQIAFGYGLFTGGLGLHYGAEYLGATIVPISGGNTQRQLQLMQDVGTTVLACTPSYALYIAETGREMGIDFSKLPLRLGIFGAEPWTEAMRQQIERELQIKAFDIFGLSEVMGPGVACECAYGQGMHIQEDHFIAEIIDPETGEQLPYGQEGELVLTSITKEALPVIRYRTRDLSVLYPERCVCGRTHVRMRKVSGRTDDMLIIRGVNVFPTQIESALLQLGQVQPHYQLIVDRKGTLDELEVWVEVTEEIFSDEVRGLEALERKVKHAIESIIGVSVKVKLVEPKTIPRTEGKAKRVIDKRKI